MLFNGNRGTTVLYVCTCITINEHADLLKNFLVFYVNDEFCLTYNIC